MCIHPEGAAISHTIRRPIGRSNAPKGASSRICGSVVIQEQGIVEELSGRELRVWGFGYRV